MARCGHCGATNLQTVQSTPLNEGAGLEPHNPPWLASQCQGQETWHRRPQSPTASTGPSGSSVFLRNNRIVRASQLTDEDTYNQDGTEFNPVKKRRRTQAA